MFGRGLDARTPDEIRAMRRSGLLVASALAAVKAAVQPGVTTRELDAVAAEVIRAGGGISNFLGYTVPGAAPYPATVCASVNDVVVHGIPTDEPLEAGDLLSIDCGAVIDGWHGDAAFSTIVGGESCARPEDLALLRMTEDSLWAGIGAVRADGRLYAIGDAIEDVVEQTAPPAPHSFGIVEDYTGHGIGREMHLEPEIYHYRVRGRGPKVPVGLTICIEPMLTLGTGETTVDDDGWTVRSADRTRAAHVEHTIAVMPGGVWVLTSPDGGRAALAEWGIPFGGYDD